MILFELIFILYYMLKMALVLFVVWACLSKLSKKEKYHVRKR